MMNGCPRWSVLTLPLLAALGCSDPVPRPAQGNLNLSIQPANTGSCPVPGKTYVIAAPPNYKAPTSSGVVITPGDRLIDGEHDATIKCSVHGSGSFTFSGTIKGLTKESERVTFTITNGVINTDKMTGTATIAVNTTQLPANYTSPVGACAITVVGDNVKPGSLWASAACPSITDPSSPGNACRVGDSTTFVLENCDGS